MVFNWLQGLFKPGSTRLELRLFTYAEADRLLITGENGWQIAPEEDTNHNIGYVWLERRRSLAASNPKVGQHHI